MPTVPMNAKPPRWVYFGAAGVMALIVWLMVGPDQYDKARTRAESIAAPPARAVETMSVSKILDLGQGNDGREICSCGFVAGTTSATANTIYVIEKRSRKHPVGVLCTWPNAGAKNSFSLPEQSPVCVRGTYRGGLLVECGAVDNCAW